MKILIAGAGEVGTHLAKLLSHESHDITIMDENPENLEFAYNDGLEIMTYVGQPTSLKDLNAAGAGMADLFIGVTPEESSNIVACILATKMGAKKTLARVNNSEYLQPENRAFLKDLGVDDMIYPEALAAKQITDSMSLPWTKQYWRFFEGKLVLVAARVIRDSPLIGKKLLDLSALEQKYFHIVAIVRGSHTIIPRGQDVIEGDDVLFATAKPNHLHLLREYCGQDDIKLKRVIIMGGSRIAVKTSQSLPSDLYIKIIEKDYEKCRKLSAIVPDNTLIIHGDGRDPDLLIDEGIKKTQAFLALTGTSESNMMATINAKRLGVPLSVAEIENLDYLDIANEMKIGNLINKKLIAAAAIFRYLLNVDVSDAKTLSIGQGEVLEIHVREHSRVTEAEVKDLRIPIGVTIGGLLRDNKVLLVEGSTRIKAGDTVMVFTDRSNAKEINHLFS